MDLIICVAFRKKSDSERFAVIAGANRSSGPGKKHSWVTCTSERSPDIFYSSFIKTDNFCDFLFDFLYTNPLLKRGYSKRKEFASLSKFFPFREVPFYEGIKNNLTVTSTMKVYQFPLIHGQVLSTYIMWQTQIDCATSSENVSSNIRKMSTYRSFCARAKYHLGLCSPLAYSVVFNDKLADSECPDQTACIRRLIWAFAVPICPKTRFRMVRPYLWYCIRTYPLYQGPIFLPHPISQYCILPLGLSSTAYQSSNKDTSLAVPAVNAGLCLWHSGQGTSPCPGRGAPVCCN